jgi:hypothetical protein
VLIDEVGLAEASSNNPLKVLHSWLDKPEVGFLGLSNWVLDASKMNRVLYVCRSFANYPDLEETWDKLSAIYEHDMMKGIPDYLKRIKKPVIEAFLEY